ncbi:MAG: hypothetical protein JWO58_1864 [Chitinophagaceae bacterium]|nr:hypothetical protein [Chitinophagaceae bacterium]
MKPVYSVLLTLCTSTLLYAQQTFSTFPVAIDKAEYDDREAVFVSDENGQEGIFLSDNNVFHFLQLDEKGMPVFDLKQNMPLNYVSLKRAGVGTLNGYYLCYLAQGNKKISVLQADVNNKSLTYSSFPFVAEKEPILFIAAGAGYAYVVTSSGELKNELTLYKYITLGQPVVTKVKTQEADIYKSLGISPNKAMEQIAVFPLNKSVHFTQAGQATKAYHSTDQLILSYDAPEGETRLLTITDANPKLVTIRPEQTADKKSVFRSILFNDHLYQLTVTSKSLTIGSTDLTGETMTPAMMGPQLESDFYFESSYSARIGYNRERKGATKVELIKSFGRSDIAGLGIMESNNGKLLLVAGLANKNSIADPTVDGGDNEQKGQLNVNMNLERNYSDLHLPSYASDQNALLRFKKEIWVYTYWTLGNDAALSKALPEDIIALDESLDLFYRDPLNNVAPAVWKQDETYLFGFYSSKNQNYNLYKISGKQAGGNMNRR